VPDTGALEANFWPALALFVGTGRGAQKGPALPAAAEGGGLRKKMKVG